MSAQPYITKIRLILFFRCVSELIPVTCVYRHICTQVAVTAKDHVPEFGPPLPDPAVFQKVCIQPHVIACIQLFTVYVRGSSKIQMLMIFIASRDN